MPNHNDAHSHSLTEKELLVYNKPPSGVQSEHSPLWSCGDVPGGPLAMGSLLWLCGDH